MVVARYRPTRFDSPLHVLENNYCLTVSLLLTYQSRCLGVRSVAGFLYAQLVHCYRSTLMIGVL